MKILITGAAGFIGSNLTEALLERGHTVIGLDNLSQGFLLNLKNVQNHRKFRFVQGDIRDEKLVRRLTRGCDVVVHLAAFKIPRYSDAMDTLLINSHGTLSVLQAAAQYGAKVVAASTSDVYGKNPNVPFSEESDLVIGRPEVKRWSYAISKMFEEQLLFAYHERHGLDVVALRFFGGYGPNQHLTWWGGPQSVFINAAIDDQEIPLHGNGLQTRSFTYISDHVDGIIASIEKSQANNQVFNIGNTREITIRDLALLIWGLVRGDEPKLKLTPYETFGKYEDVMRRVPDISKARRLLDFDPKVELEQGLKTTIRWQIERRRALGMPTPEIKLRFEDPTA
ncbi:MAG: nucleoside-diphosphate sugar epimerase [Anaerolineae bacterium]|nr:MAG: nucleoside-diphosphate sugar epimerase [Anaerolineae bacterium]